MNEAHLLEQGGNYDPLTDEPRLTYHIHGGCNVAEDGYQLTRWEVEHWAVGRYGVLEPEYGYSEQLDAEARDTSFWCRTHDMELEDNRRVDWRDHLNHELTLYEDEARTLRGEWMLFDPDSKGFVSDYTPASDYSITIDDLPTFVIFDSESGEGHGNYQGWCRTCSVGLGDVRSMPMDWA